MKKKSKKIQENQTILWIRLSKNAVIAFKILRTTLFYLGIAIAFAFAIVSTILSFYLGCTRGKAGMYIIKFLYNMIWQS